MIQNCSKLRVYDNSGANVVKCFKTFKFKNNAKLNKIENLLNWLLNISINSINLMMLPDLD